ncbi:MAG TPA: PKD domain-containing protein, partial [Methanoculleus sp.]|nr:PKD domain-containing protein [Methanoculleus sp.]
APLAVQFNDTSTGDPVSWLWDFGDGTTAADQNVTSTFTVPGVFPVTLTVANETGDEASAVQEITVEEPPEETPDVPPAVPLNASFIANVTEGFAPLDVQFNDTSTGDPVSWLWDFGDGSVSPEQNLTYTYVMPGLYPVTLTVANETGDEASAVENITVLVPPLNASFIATPPTGPAPLTVQFTDLSTGFPVDWFWEFGDGRNDTAQNPVHEYPEEGVYQVNLTVENATGVNDTAAGFVEVVS